MTLESKMKKTMLSVAVEAALRQAKRAPERCARNLMELGERAYPGFLNDEQLKCLQTYFISLCKQNDLNGIKEAFFFHFGKGKEIN